MDLKFIPLDDVKNLAKRLCTLTRDVSFPLTHSAALNVVSAMIGYRNYNTLRAQHQSPRPLINPEVKLEPSDNLTSFLNKVFTLNETFQKNMQSVFLPAYCIHQIEDAKNLTTKSLDSLGRKYILVDAEGKSELEIYNSIISDPVRTVGQGFSQVEMTLMERDIVIVLVGVSRANFTRKADFVRGLVKVLDDAHFDNKIPKGNMVFIDYSSFLEKSWNDIGIYFAVTGPSYYMT
ncbi:glyoxalase superfamily protein [Lelliottia sp. V106_10]|uniref:glyoxalase superfamily protein n=1 Tax=Lelliottia wanjuensis TaxID=3050585 RepID=UPI00254F5F3E|nr:MULTISPECIES: glyoxalase superfamily protein [unclassified Lelliottia]MDK9354860.1 glyoxalase superfamily protein [Lelliottia sp. V106_16]MDK9372068.1 glyoxalase superfamily protein [Lelliottia sp. V106_10]MDK9598704.1 glyoxalase superfamily protein [Lelliottia sp. V106_5]